MPNQPQYTPSPRDIRTACEAIQATWSTRERAKRSRLAAQVAVKLIRLNDVGLHAAWVTHVPLGYDRVA